MALPITPRQITIAKPTAASRHSGTFPNPTTIPNRSNHTPSKGREAKLKVLVRRLAPGLTEEEFHLILGEGWKVGRGKVDWISYQKGKVSKE